MKIKAIIFLLYITVSCNIAFSAVPPFVSTSASVNLIQIDSDSSLASGASVFSSASGNGAQADARSGSGFSIGTTSISENSNLLNRASTSASTRAAFEIQGNSAGKTIPLQFNFQLTGVLSASSDPDPRGVSIGTALNNYSVSIATPSEIKNLKGSATLLSTRGIPTMLSTGSFGINDVVARVTPKINYQGATNVLTDQTLDDLGLSDLDLEIEVDPLELESFETSAITGSILGAIGAIGIPAIFKIPDDGLFDLGFDVDFIFNQDISISVDVTDGGVGSASLVTSAASTLNAKGESKFGNTLILESITLPSEITTVDASELQVIFNNGQTFSVERDKNMNPVPLPPSIIFFISGLFGLSYLRFNK